VGVKFILNFMFQSEDSGNDSDTSESLRKRKRFDDAAIERRMERRKWEENRCDMQADQWALLFLLFPTF